MALKQCDKCTEMADEAKAFCPACGNPFVVEEQRQEASKFDSLDSTMQMGNTMFNIMLSDMGLNTKERPGLQKQVEILKPIAPAAPVAPVGKPKPIETQPQSERSAPPAKKTSNAKLYILGGIVIVVLLFLIMLVVAFLVYQIYFR